MEGSDLCNVLDMTLRFRIELLLDTSPDGRDAARRVVLVDRETELQHELAVAFLLDEFGQTPLNTQIAVLSDLAFFLEWQLLRTRRAEASGKAKAPFISPEGRVLVGNRALTNREVTEYCRWACLSADKLATALRDESSTFALLATGKAVKFGTSNRRIRTTGTYVAWLTKECDPRLELTAEEHRMLEASAQSIRMEFHKHLAAGDDSVEVRSLDDNQRNSLERAIGNGGPFPQTPTGLRDRLIVETLNETGLRAGELLKLCCVDVIESWEYKPGRFTGCIKVVEAQNDPADTRLHEPACKTGGGLVPISTSLAAKLIEYIVGDREAAVFQSNSATPFLFVNHEGKYEGSPLGRRNLNRILAKLKSFESLPSTISPHVLRHTNLNHVYKTATSKGRDAREIVIQRGRWSTKSTMPDRYAARAIEERSAELVQQRDQIIS